MLLRRVKDHVVRQNWTAIAIDCVIVVVGVFVGTQVSNWNSDRLDQGSPWRTVLAFYQASQMLPFPMDDTTYQELKSAGDLGLIRDPRLRNALAEYYVTGPLGGSPHLLQYNPEYRTLVRGYTPTPVSDYIWQRCVAGMGSQTETFDPDCQSPISDAEARAILERYVAVPNMLPALRFWVINQKVAHALLSVAIREAEALERQVAAAQR